MAKTRFTLKRTHPVPQACPGQTAGAAEHPTASARWLAGALLGTLLLAAISLYAATCLLFWQGQWQLVFHPSRTVNITPASVGLKYDNIRFGATETGVLQLAGWWIPAGPGTRLSGATLLFLRDGSGSLANSVAQIETLHRLGINIFAFDYRGFGASANAHPSEERTYEDAGSAWRYLTETRHIAPGSIVIYGEGLGAAVAVECALRHPGIAGAIFEDLPPPTLDLLARNPRLRWLPVRLIFHDRFDPTGRLGRLSMPKLFFYSAATANREIAARYYAEAAEPKTEVAAGAGPGAGQGGQALYLDKAYLPALRRFLDAHLEQPG